MGQAMWNLTCYQLSSPALFCLFIVGFAWILRLIAANPSTYSLDDYSNFSDFKYYINQRFVALNPQIRGRFLGVCIP